MPAPRPHYERRSVPLRNVPNGHAGRGFALADAASAPELARLSRSMARIRIRQSFPATHTYRCGAIHPYIVRILYIGVGDALAALTAHSAASWDRYGPTTETLWPG